MLATVKKTMKKAADAPGKGVSAMRVAELQRAEDAVRECEARIGALELEQASFEEHCRLVERQWKADTDAKVCFAPLFFFPSEFEGGERGARGARIAGDMRTAVDRLRTLRERASELQRAARPLSPAACARLAELVRVADADSELLAAGISAAVLTRTVEGREHLKALANEFNISID